MEQLYFWSALVGGAVLVVQTLFLLIGLGDSDLPEADTDGFDPHQTHAFFRILSFKTLVAFFTFFGLTGMALKGTGLGSVPTVLASVGAGCVAFFLVAQLMGALARLQSDGSLELDHAVGEEAKVYLRVPGHGQGQGKVTLYLQGRTVEVKAVTPGPELVSGAQVRVVGVRGGQIVEVVAAGQES